METAKHRKHTAPYIVDDQRAEDDTPTAVHFSDRSLLSSSFTPPKSGMDDDTDIDRPFPLTAFALGSTRNGGEQGIPGEVRFLRGFGSSVHKGPNSRLNFNLDRQWIYIKAAPTNVSSTPPALLPLEAEVPFEDIAPQGVRIVVSHATEDGHPTTLTLATRRPARFFMKIRGKPIMRRATERDFVFSIGPAESIDGRSVEEMKVKGFIIHEGHAGPLDVVPDDPMAIPVGSWLTWQFHMTLSPAALQRLRSMVLDLRRYGLERGIELVARTNGRLRSLPIEKMDFVNPDTVLSKLEFRLRYLVEGLVSQGICVPAELPRLVDSLDRHCSSVELQDRVLSSLFSMDGIHDITSQVQARAKKLRQRRVKISDHQSLVYSCTVTATRVCLNPPEPEAANDMLRLHQLQADRFLRVKFADENGPLLATPPILEADLARASQGILARMRRALTFGLVVGGRRYVFLGYSRTSLRDRSCWFVAEDQGFTANSVRATLGFDRMSDRIPASHAYRMGVPFFPSRPVPVPPTIKKFLPDIQTEDNQTTFTKGTGRCGVRIAEAAASALGVETGLATTPSAIQVQAGGITGTLSVWPELCGPEDVSFRQSQIQFETDTRTIQFGLNVLKIAQYHRGFLNRRLMLLLSHLGVSDAVLEHRIAEYLERSLGLAQRFETGNEHQRDRVAADRLCKLPLVEMSSAGFDSDLMFLTATQVLESKLLSDLRWNGKLEIAESVQLMGIADEAGVLEADEVFCQYQDPKDPWEAPRIVSGKCVIMRESALHPGEIQTIKAVDHPELHHLKNVIVFPVRAHKRGKPLPELLFGDLGEDDYILIWDEYLLPKRQEQVEVADVSKGTIVNGVKEQHLKEFFVRYAVRDVLDDILTSQLAFADNDGPMSATSVALIREARIAKSFQYTGVFPGLHSQPKPKHWPTFMCNDGVPPSAESYDSLEILGKLFTMTGSAAVLDAIEMRAPYRHTSDPRLECYQIPSSVLDDAYKLKRDYDDAVYGLMRRFEVSEAEAISGCILRGRPTRTGDEDEEDRMVQSYKAIAANADEHATRFLARRVFKGKLEPRQIYALAAYQVTNVPSVLAAVEARLGVRSSSPVSSVAASSAQSTVSVATAPTIVAASKAPSAPASVSGNAVNEDGSRDSRPSEDSQPLISFPWVFWQSICNLPNVSN